VVGSDFIDGELSPSQFDACTKEEIRSSSCSHSSPRPLPGETEVVDAVKVEEGHPEVGVESVTVERY
jgi:hypothetical protein